jgi:hypothetical protein
MQLQEPQAQHLRLFFVIFPKNILTNHTKSATIKVDKIPVKPGDFMCKRENRSVQALSPKGVFL